ncbi:DUF262 domain-containing protein [Streptosporangium oxazolinicum]|uniref:DUF262 domain-containing protein n=1 Tax=Streptosporangium oxazolinicum TaxID=909287 RepID=A0ABP8AED9_9ACTN
MSQELDFTIEPDLMGEDFGVELEQPDGEITAPFDPEKIDVQTRTMTVDLLMARLRRKVLDLEPNFQRRAGIWNEGNQSRLIESLLLRIPLPTLYAAESGEESWVVVDGIQRLTTIARFVTPQALGSDTTPLILTGLEYLRNYEGKAFDELPLRLQTRINETELVIHLVRSGTPEQVMFNIFARINTGGTPLSLQELRHALIPGRSRQILAELARSDEFLHATQRSVSPFRMADREMVLRFLAFRLTPPDDYPRGDLDSFLRDATHRVNQLDDKLTAKLSEEFSKSMLRAAAIFEEHAFRKRFRNQSRRLPVNKALFEAVSVNLATLTNNQFTQLADKRHQVQENLMDLMNDTKFQQAISLGTGDKSKVTLRFNSIAQLFKGLSK